MTVENRELASQPESIKPTLALVRERLAANPNVAVISDEAEPRDERLNSFSTASGTCEILEDVKLRIAPTTPIANPDELNKYMDELLEDMRLKPSWKTEARFNYFEKFGDNSYAFILPDFTLYETLGELKEEVQVTRTGTVFDKESLEKYGKDLEDGEKVETTRSTKEYERRIEIKLYPDKSLAELYTIYKPQKKGYVGVPLPPGTQHDLDTLWHAITPQLYQRWLAGEDLANFYFSPEGKLIPRFYRIPTDKIEEAKRDRSPGAFLRHGDFTEVFNIVDGTETGARIMLSRTYRNLTPEQIAERVDIYHHSRQYTEYIRSVENGKINPNEEQLRRICSHIGVMSDEFEATQIFPEGHTPLPKYPRRENKIATVVFNEEKHIHPKTNTQTFGSFAREKRIGLGLSQKALGTLIGYSSSAISALERDAYQSMNPETISQMAKIFGFDKAETILFVSFYKKQTKRK